MDTISVQMSSFEPNTHRVEALGDCQVCPSSICKEIIELLATCEKFWEQEVQKRPELVEIILEK